MNGRRVEAPSSQDGYRIVEWGVDPVWHRFDVESPGPGEVLIGVEACGIGLTVLNMIRGDLSDDRATLPRVPGHELVGRVLEGGAGVDPELVGRRVTTYVYLFCGTCPECIGGFEDRCRRLAGYVGVHRDGGYAPYTVLPARNAIPVPEELDPVAATVIPDAVSTSVHVCRSRARVGPDDRVAVIGAGGGVGIHAIQVAAVYGARVAGLDVEDDKLAAIETLGARPVPSHDFGNLAAELWDGDRPTVVIDFVGSPESLGWALNAVGSGGRVVVLTTFRDVTAVLDPRRLVMAEASILGSRYATRHEVRLAASLVAEGRVRPIIGATTGPAGAPDIHERLRTRRLVGRGALTWGHVASDS
jgi:D-arabinose 1-dehydrogenase-like Zn-dependent alcohol dehydrogenase